MTATLAAGETKRYDNVLKTLFGFESGAAGAIRITANETHFQVPRAIADRFASAVQRTAGTEDGGDVAIELAPDTPRDTARQNRKGNDTRPRPAHAGGEGKKPWHKRPHRKGPRPQ